MKKKNLLLAMATTLCISCAFTGCGSDEKDNGSTTTAPNATEAETESTTAAAEVSDVLGYWEVSDALLPSYYFFDTNQMEVITMGMKMAVEAEITDSSITTNMLGEESTITYVIENDILKITEDGETVELKRITKADYDAVVESLDNAELDDDFDDDENEDPGVNGYVVEPGVTMTITEDDGTVVVYANDGDGTYIKSTTPPSDDTDENTED